MKLRIRTKVKGDVVCATLALARKGKRPMVLMARVPLQEVRQVFKRVAEGNYDMGEQELGWGFFKKIAKKVKKVAKAVARNKLVKVANKLSKNPVIGAMLPPQVHAAIKVANFANKLVNRAAGGDPKARAIVAKAKARAMYRKRPSRANRARVRRADARGRALIGTKGSMPMEVHAPSGRVFKTLVTMQGALL